MQESISYRHPAEEAYDPDRDVQYAFVPAAQKDVTALGPAEQRLLPLRGDFVAKTDLGPDLARLGPSLWSRLEADGRSEGRPRWRMSLPNSTPPARR